jgi:hypothetical protein
VGADVRRWRGPGLRRYGPDGDSLADRQLGRNSDRI